MQSGSEQNLSLPCAGTTELGLPGYDMPGWYASVASAGIDREVLTKLVNDINEAPYAVTY